MESLFRTIRLKHFSNFIKIQTTRSKSTLAKPNKENFIILRATRDDYDKILKLMRRAYYPEEPTTSSLAFKPTTVFEDSTIKSLSEGYSLIAKCKYNDDILGVAINETTHCWDPELKDKLACKVNCVKSRQLLHFYAYMQRAPNIWEKYGVQKVFEIAYLFVRRNERGKGIAKKLMEQSRILAADCAFTLIRVDATSHYTSQLCEKLKMKLIQEIPYCSYIGYDQRPIFNPPDPHKSVKIYVDDEPQKNALNSNKRR